MQGEQASKLERYEPEPVGVATANLATFLSEQSFRELMAFRHSLKRADSKAA